MSLGPLMVDVAGVELTRADREILAHPLVGSVILFTRNYVDPPQLARLVGDIRAVRSPALLVAVDHEGGRVQRFRGGFSALPAMRQIGHVFDLDAEQGLETARRLGWLMAAELLAVGVDFSFAPCVDLDYGFSTIIGDRALHRRAEAVAAWRRVSAPTLWIEPAEPELRRKLGVSDEAHAEARASFRDFREVQVADSGHNLHHDQPGRVARIVEAFLLSKES